MESYSIKDLSFSYPEQKKLVLDHITLTVKKGEFLVFCGPSGSGKTTFLRQLKSVISPHGAKTGSILFEGTPLEELNQREQSSRIGYVLQSPENQLVTDKVWHELAFGMESLGFDTPAIRLRVAEMASFFGIQNWFYKNVEELSGGQKQLLNLAAIMTMQPSVLILDEPTSQLDPIAASDFLATVSKINREIGTTIILTEHRLEEAMPLADRAVVMDKGKIIADGTPKEVGQILRRENHKMFLAMPVPMRIYAGVPNDLSCPVTVREGHQWLDAFAKKHSVKSIGSHKADPVDRGMPAAELKEAWFRYEKDMPDVAKGVSVCAYPGEFLAILGGNGTGKTTTLSLISGLNRPYRGDALLFGRNISKVPDSEKFGGMLGVLPQNPQSLFVKKSVELDLYEMLKGLRLSNEEQKKRVDRVSRICELTELMDRHPYDLSGGEQQRAALAKVLLTEPKLLLLDEPTKGMDAEFKITFGGILKRLLSQEVSVVMVSHDIEFCAQYADRCALFFDGGIVTEGKPSEFFSGNSFYTTAANRMSRNILPYAVTAEDVIRACGGNPLNLDSGGTGDEYDLTYGIDENKDKNNDSVTPSQKTENTWGKKRMIVSAVSLIIAIFAAVKVFPIISGHTWSSLIGVRESEGIGQWKYAILTVLFTVSAAVFFMTVFQRSNPPPLSVIQVEKDKRKLSKRTVVASVLILCLIPFTIFFGVYYLENKKYYFISLLIILETMIPFAMIFEGRKPQARELVIISVLCAIGVAGRTAFFMLPNFKPVAAICIVSGVAFGGESGFMVGAMTMLLSNVMFGQGTWTPWQMFAMGLIGFLAGVLFKKGLLRRDRISMAVFGGIAVFIIYGGIMDPASAIMFQDKINWPIIATYMVMGVPINLVHASATVFFLLLIGEPMLEKLDRIKIKYGLMEE
jgi:energy-coupling factor transport system ATP-binding protein